MFAQLLDTTKKARSLIKGKKPSIGIGLADSSIAKAMSSELAQKLGDLGFTVALYHDQSIAPHPTGQEGLLWHPSRDPVQELISDFKDGKLQAIIRGQISSSTFLAELKRQFSLDRTYRLALLATSAGKEFFFAPVGIDEGSDPQDKQTLIELAAGLLERLAITPSFFLLSAGRLDDMYRGEQIARSIKETLDVVERCKARHPSMSIQHGEILIENAFDKGANTILAPDGISGNLIYRTLLHLGGGHSHGAYYLGSQFTGPVMDTSRVGSIEEYVGAVVLALRLIVSRG